MSPERSRPRQPSVEAGKPARPSGVPENPLACKTNDNIQADAEKFCSENGLHEKITLFRIASLLAKSPRDYMERTDISDQEKVILREEISHRWKQPKSLYYVAIISSLAAIVQGMDESVINGAMGFYFHRFGIGGPVEWCLHDPSICYKNDKYALVQGLVNAAPYLCCFVLACWLTTPLNDSFGRRGTIWISCFIAGAASIWEAFTYTWPELFAARLLLGLGIGPKSTTAPVYTAECAPAPIRGALVMMWQMWTAFGIMLGYIVGVIFAPSDESGSNTAWRLMLGSTVVPPIFVCSMIYFGPESPRWYYKKKRYLDSFKSMCRLRRSELQAARDLYYMRAVLMTEEELNQGKNMLKELVTVPRNRRAMVASGLVMFMQQFCGVNVIAYYSTTIFTMSGYKLKHALYASLGTGILNWLFAIPAFYTIDTLGRRLLLLITFPLMAVCLLVTGFAFFIPSKNSAPSPGPSPGFNTAPSPSQSSDGYNKATIAVVTLGIYMYEIFYSPGEGPVPYTYSAEAFPLHIRELGMSYATSVTWCFNFVLAVSWPKLVHSFKPQGAFGFYAGWCIIGWVAVFLILPETKGKTLEELNQIFDIPHRKHIRYQIAMLKYNIERFLGKSPKKVLPLYASPEENEQGESSGMRP